jgi:hypothetical protein
VSGSVVIGGRVDGSSTNSVRVVDDGSGTSVIASGDLGLGDTTTGDEGSGVEAVSADSVLQVEVERRTKSIGSIIDHDVGVSSSCGVSVVDGSNSDSNEKSEQNRKSAHFFFS